MCRMSWNLCRETAVVSSWPVTGWQHSRRIDDNAQKSNDNVVMQFAVVVCDVPGKLSKSWKTRQERSRLLGC